MATNQTIKLKRGTTTPTTSNIASGEVAIDTSAQKFYVNDAGTIKEVGPGAAGDFAVDTDTLFVDVSTDRVGINTSSPAEELHISAALPTIRLQDSDGTNQYAQIYFNDGNFNFQSRNNTSHGEINFVTYNGTDIISRLFIRDNGNVGIGDTAPTNTLTIKSSNPTIRLEDSDGSGGIAQIQNTANGNLRLIADPDDDGSSSSSIEFEIDGSEKARFDSSGRLGIGTTSPNQLLDVEGTTDPSIRIRSTGTGSSDDAIMSIQIGGTSAESRINFGDNDDGDVGRLRYDHSNNHMIFQTNASEAMRIDSSGRLGIGTTSPNQLLDVEGTTDPSIRIRSTGTGSSDDAIMSIQIGGTSAESRINFGDNDDGDVGRLRYDHSNDNLDLYVAGVHEFRFESGGTFHADGDVVAYSTTVPSDATLKYNINPVENALDKLNSLDGVTFQWKKDDKASAGVIAQDVEKVMPSAVKEVESLKGDSTHKAVDYNQIIALLVEAVKDQQKQIDELRK